MVTMPMLINIFAILVLSFLLLICLAGGGVSEGI